MAGNVTVVPEAPHKRVVAAPKLGENDGYYTCQMSVGKKHQCGGRHTKGGPRRGW